MILSRREIIWATLVITLGLFLRLYRLSDNLQIHYDQGLHAVGIWRIWHDRQPSLLGHPTDADGIWHGPFYYWLMTPAYFLGQGEPAFASAFQILIEAVSLYFLVDLGKRMFNYQTGILALGLYSISYGFISYSRWLSNVTPTFPLSILFAWLSWRIFKGEVKFLPWAALVASAITQLNGAIGVFLYPVLVVILLFGPSRRELTLRLFLLTMFLTSLPHLPLLVFELRHHWVITQSIFRLSASSSAGIGASSRVVLGNLSTLYQEIWHLISYPVPIITSLMLLAAGWYLLRHLRRPPGTFFIVFVGIFFCSLSFYQRGALLFFFVPLFSLFVLLISRTLLVLPRWLSLGLLVMIFASNILSWQNLLIPHHLLTPIGTFNLITNRDRKAAVDWIYQKSGGQPFAVWIYTIPYFHDEPWVYYFDWYGQPRYGYLPTATANFSSHEIAAPYAFFDIWEPDDNQRTRLASWQNQVDQNFGPSQDLFISNDVRVDYRGIFTGKPKP